MIALRKETKFSISELRHVCITCPHCGTEVILDMARYERPVGQVRERMIFAPRQCPGCRQAYDTALTALEDLQQAYAALSRLDGVVSFRAEEPGQ